MDEQTIYRKLTEIFRDVFDDNSLVLTPETTAAEESPNGTQLIT